MRTVLATYSCNFIISEIIYMCVYVKYMSYMINLISIFRCYYTIVLPISFSSTYIVLSYKNCITRATSRLH